MKTIEIYTDGACSHNPGMGGWAAVCKCGDFIRKVSGGEKETTNNRMELAAVIGGLKALKSPHEVIVYTDSKYMIDVLCGHTPSWINIPGRKNQDLLLEIIKTKREGGHKVKFVKIPAHSGNAMNELADKLAKAEIVKLRHEVYGGK